MKIKILSALVLSVFAIPSSASACGDHLAFGVPGKSDQQLCRIGYASGYNYEHQAPDWVSYKLTRESVSLNAVARKNNFAIDRDIPREYRANHADYKGSGYDRGHLAPSASMDFSYEAMKESFLLSNMVPQKAGFNRYGFGRLGAWGALEGHVRSWAVKRGEVFVITGPVYSTVIDVIGDGIEVPGHFFKIIFDPRLKASIAFLIPHEEDTSARLESYITSIDHIESLTGFDFLGEIADEDELDIEDGIANSFKYWSMRDGRAPE